MSIFQLLKIIGQERHIFIQTHNFPDHDSVASAFGLQELLVNLGKPATILYDGLLERSSLKDLCIRMGIKAWQAKEVDLKPEDKIVIVDGCKYNKNVTDLIGDEIGIIDHHEVSAPEDVLYIDIRPSYGGCVSIIFDYYKEAGLPLSQKLASVFLCGLQMDTQFMTRGVSPSDLELYTTCYNLADINLVNQLLRNYIQQEDLQFYKRAIERLLIKDGFAFCYFDEGCNQNLLGIIGDFLLSLREADLVFLCAKNNEQINFSVRSEVKRWHAAQIIQTILKGRGYGGGHAEMAAGIIPSCPDFSETEIFAKLHKLLISLPA